MARSETVESIVKSDIEELGDLTGAEPTLAALATRLAKAIDKATLEDPRLLPVLTKELRITMAALTDGRGDGGDDDDTDLATPA